MKKLHTSTVKVREVWEIDFSELSKKLNIPYITNIIIDSSMPQESKLIISTESQQ
jgi:hypothetical protein